MSEEEIIEFLESNGYPAHIIAAGSEGLIRRWNEFVGEVENGYPYGLHEYRHDLDLRAAIALFGLDDRVRDADQRLADVLIANSIRVWESGGDNPWWDFGVPRNATGRLLRDLRREGLLDVETDAP